MPSTIIDEKIVRYKFELDELLTELHDFTFSINNSDLQHLVSNLRTNINEPFLFVVIGEIKAGKSSFINALLKEDICKVDPAPCTDVIQKIVYSDKKTEIDLKSKYRQIGLPVEILRTIAIVDTPGTNTLLRDHEELTQRFIPNGDLVIFVFPAKNPHTQSSWDVLDYVSEEWRKKVVFVLQQADLTKEGELKTNIEKLREYAIKRNITNPRIFATSAEWEAEGKPDSGFDEMRAFIKETATGGRHYQLKLLSILDTTDQAVSRIGKSLSEREARFAKDSETVANVKNRLSVGEKQSAYEIKSLIERLVSNYDRIAGEVKSEFKDGLSIFSLFKKSFGSIFKKEKSINSWIMDLQRRFEKRLHATFEDIASDGAYHFLEGIRNLLKSLIDDLNSIQDKPVYRDELFTKISDKRGEVIADVKNKVAQLLQNDSFVDSLKSSPEKIAPTVFGGGVLAIIGTIIITAAHGAFFDVTGGILTGIGVLIASSVIIFRKGKIIRQLEKGLNAGKKQFEIELTEKLGAKLKIIYEDVNRSFVDFYEYVSREEETLLPLVEQFKDIHDSYDSLAGRISSDFRKDEK
ncbi:MAG: dynamin family protein [candidate division KSB1 bacterium]|jgi:ribosome biogenesis GTPase A|nr:dynamin family protein [candidate division KSB1 bacterium]